MINIIDKHACCGCTACASICKTKAIAMRSDEEGFLYPIVNTSLCVDCHLCEYVCPVLARDSQRSFSIPSHVFALYHKNKEVHQNSSSGGVFTAFVDEVMRRNGIVYGVAYNERLEVVHSKGTTLFDCQKFRGSKYVQSDIRNIYTDVRSYLSKGILVLFSGTPCQVEGLKRFLLNKKYSNLITIDILCHGVSSPKVFSDYIRFIKRYSIGHLENIFMKDKTFGWGYQDLRLYYREGSTEFHTPLSSLWNKIYYDHIVNRPSCHQCRFMNLHRTGDISIGDFWGIEKAHKEFYSSKGVSLLMINTEKGLNFWEYVKHNFEYLESDINKCLQPVLEYPQSETADRRLFWDKYFKYGFDETIRNRYGITRKKLLKNNVVQIINILRQK